MSSTQRADLKVSIFRDRNFKTPYYSNPYGYAKHIFQNKTLKSEPVSIGSSPIKIGGNRAFNLNTKSILSPLATDSPLREKKMPVKIVLNEDLFK